MRGDGDYCSEERGRSRCGAEASPRQDGGGARTAGAGSAGAKPYAGAWGGVPRCPGPPGSHGRQHGEQLWAPGSAAASARGGSRLPRSCGARAARSREKRGKQQARGREREERERGTRGQPRLDRLRALGDPPPGAPRSGKSPSPWTWRVTSSQLTPSPPPSGPGSWKGSGDPRRPSGRPFRCCRSHLPPPAAEWVGQPSLRSPPLLTRSVPPSASDPPSPPACGRSLHPGDVGGKGESFRARELPALSPRPPSPSPPHSSPRTAHQIEAALH